MAEGKGRESDFGHLYDREAPWTGLPRGDEFAAYLNSTPEHELNEKEKKCLKKLQKAYGDGDGEEKETVAPNFDTMPWHLIKNPSDVIYYLYGDPLPTQFNQNITGVLRSLQTSGKQHVNSKGKVVYDKMSIDEICEYAKAKSGEVKQNYLNDKVKEQEETKDMNFIEKFNYKINKSSVNYINQVEKGGESGPSVFFKLSVGAALKAGKITALQSKQPEAGKDKQKENPDKDKQKQDDGHQQEQTQQDDAELQ